MQLLVHRPQDLVDRLICWWTRGNYSHAAVLIGPNVFEAVPGAGVHAVDAARYFARYPRSQYACFEVPGADDAAGRAWAQTQLGKRYDWRAIFGFAVLDRATRERAGYWECAEFAYVLAAKAGVWLFDPLRTNPAQLAPSLLPLSRQLSQTTA